MILYNLILFLAGLHLNRTLGYLGFLLLLGGMTWGTLEYRKTLPGGFIAYGKAFTSCFMIGLFAAILGAIYMYAFAQFIHPGLMQEMADAQQAALAAKNLTDEQLEQAMAMASKFTSPVMMTIFGFLGSLFFSLILGLLAAIFLKKEDTSVPSAQ